MVNSGPESPSSTGQGNPTPPASPAVPDVDASSLAGEFESLSADYQNVIRSAQHQHGIRIVPLQELKGGFTGAALYLVSVSSPGSGKLEHLVLKLDRPEAGKPDELDRHKRALEQAPPDFAREHMAEVAFDRVELDGSIAIFYRIAGESLHGYRPLVAFQQQNQVQAIFSVLNREVLTRWNEVAAGFDQAVHPQSLLSRWLTNKLRPQGNIEKFFNEVRRIDGTRPGLLVQGRAYPNPLVFAREANLWGRARLIDSFAGFQHGDMNVNNVLVKFGEDGANLEGYYFIDFAFFEERMPLLYDQAYLEMSFLLPYVATVDFARWVDLVTGFASQDIPDPQRVPIELAGAAAAISAGRREFNDWIRANHMSLTDDLWGQYWLAATAAGLNFCGKRGLSEQQRLGGLIYAAAHLKRYCEKFGVPLPVDVAHLYEASHIGDEPEVAAVVSRPLMPAISEPENKQPVQPASVIGREEETPEVNDLLSNSRINRDIGRVFVGRQREMAQLTAALEEAISGQGRLFMLVGEPGIGKTRTTQELASYAENRGAKVFWGRCYEEEGAPPYWPWVQTMRSYVQQASAEQLNAEMGAGAADIAEIVPEVRVKLPGLEAPPALEPESARFRLFDSITTFLKNASQSQPLMLVLDDLHWADRSSLRLLEFLARELGASRLLVVGCYRDMGLSRQHPLSETLAQVSREPVFRRQVLRGLAQQDTVPFVQATTGVQLSQELAEILYAHTEGNPFFLTEVISLLAERGELESQDVGRLRDIRIPEGVREAIGQRLNRLSEQCNQALTTASIIGREFDFKLLVSLNGEGIEDRVLEALEEALAARVIEESSGTIGGYQFTHALIQETLAQELSATRRARLHGRVAEALEALYGDDAEPHAAELAHHFAQAEAVLGPEKLVRYSHLAGERALAHYAWEDALDHFRRGLAAKGFLLEGDGPATDSQEAELLFGYGRAMAGAAGRTQMQLVADSVGRAFDFFHSAGDIPRAVEVAEYPLPVISGGRTAMATFYGRALELVNPESLSAARLLSSHGAELGRVEGDYSGAQQAFNQALLIARKEEDESLEVRILAASANVDFHHLQFEDSLEKAFKVIETAQATDDLSLELNARLDAVRVLGYQGDPESARRQCTACLELAEKLRDRPRLALACRAGATLYRLLGEWGRARAISDRALAVAPGDVTILADRVYLEYELGEWERGEVFLEQLIETMRGAPPRGGVRYARPAAVLPYIARLTDSFDLLDIALTAADKVLGSSASEPIYVTGARTGMALVAILRRDIELAETQYDLLSSAAPMVGGSTNNTHRVLGLLAQTLGNLDKAATHFEENLAFCRKAGYRPELAWTCCDYADTLRERGGPGDEEKAMSLLDESLAISSELGMRPLMERVLSRREILTA